MPETCWGRQPGHVLPWEIDPVRGCCRLSCLWSVRVAPAPSDRPAYPSHSRGLRRHLAALALAVIAGLACPAVRAQSGPPSLKVPASVVIEPGKDAGLGLAVDPGKGLPAQTFVRIRGLPTGVVLSDGQLIQPGAWAIPVSGVSGLRMSAPVDAAGRADMVVSLLTIDGDVLSEARVPVTIAPLWLLNKQAQAAVPDAGSRTSTVAPAGPATNPAGDNPPLSRAPAESAPHNAPASLAPPTGTQGPPPRLVAPQPQPAARPPLRDASAASPPAPVISALGQAIAENARRFLARGNEQLAQGNVQEARLFLRRAAELGSAEAALTMAATYDANEIKRLRLYGPKPDPDEARSWYERAKELGAPDADRLLARLGGTEAPAGPH